MDANATETCTEPVPSGALRPRWWVAGLTPAERPADAPPAWAVEAERAVRAAGRVRPAGRSGEPWDEAFASVLRPLVLGARRRVQEVAAGIDGRAPVDATAIAAGFAAQLGRRLARTAARTLVLELNVRRVGGRLTGEDGRRRFADFIRGAAAPSGLADLFATYPVLARLLAEASLAAADAHAELLARYAADRPAIVHALLGGTDPGRLTAVEVGLGDAHRRARSVCGLTFAGGARVVYKPRDVAVHRLFADLLDWLNRAVPDLRLRSPAALVRPGYGWLEFAAARPLADAAAVGRFYRRQGALLALLHLVHACDIHHGNLVACGDQPVLVDLETLLHPVLPRPEHVEDPAALALAESVHRTALLPFAIVGDHGAIDPSGLGGDAVGAWPTSAVAWEDAGTDRMRLTRRPAPFTGGRNRPRLAGRDVEPADHVEPLVRGFRLAYDAVARDRTDFLAVLRHHAGVQTRIVGRPSRVYAELLDETTHPELLRDAADREQALGVLATLASDPVRWALLPHEVADLLVGEMPLFLTRPDSPDVWTSSGQPLPGLLGRDGLSATEERVATLGEADRQRQEWIISASLATRRPWPDDGGGDAPMPGPLTRTVAEPTHLLAAACGIADQLVARSLPDRDRVNWLGLDLAGGRWTVSPLGAGLGNGYAGVALFLAQLAALTGVARYRDVARQALASVPRLCDALTDRPDLVRAAGIGAYNGLGGVAYALARVGVLLDDSAARGWAERVVTLAASVVDDAGLGGPPGVADGTAGCLAAMVAVDADLGLDAAAHLAGRCAGRLAGLPAGPVGGPKGGFADGAAGIGWALGRLAARLPSGGDGALAEAARSALAEATRSGLAGPGGNGTGRGHGWYAGTAGVVAARAESSALVGTDADPGITAAVRALAARPVRRDLSLRHGELGIAEALAVWTARSPGFTTRPLRDRAGLILDAIRRFGPLCGTPDDVPTPGLLSGLAGIGYGLLRLGFADRVPSALLLEPSVPAG